VTSLSHLTKEEVTQNKGQTCQRLAQLIKKLERLFRQQKNGCTAPTVMAHPQGPHIHNVKPQGQHICRDIVTAKFAYSQRPRIRHDGTSAKMLSRQRNTSARTLSLQRRHILNDTVSPKMLSAPRHVGLDLIGTMMGFAATPWDYAIFHFLCQMNIITLAHFNLQMGLMEANNSS
jgi:hypothetical protein